LPPRSGFSLLELMLVLALLVTMAAFTWPVMERSMASERLRKGADQVRSEWVRTRLRAMTTGVPQVFNYEPEGIWYSVEDYAGLDAGIETTSLSAFADITGEAAVAGGLMRELPEGLVFVESMVDDLRSTAVDPAAMPAAGQPGPVFFYPDGTSSNASLRLRNEYDEYIDLHLRGLTGVVTVTEVLTAEELP
jgi:prepilin-type N-terminal cleavage/methylation domain-containing protein